MSKPNKRRQAKQKARAESIRKRKAAPPPAPKTPLEDNYLTERAMRRALLLRDGVPFENEEQADAFLAKSLGDDLTVDELALEQVESDPVESAQEIGFQALAWEEVEDEDHSGKVVRLANKALGIDPLCLDAHTARLRVEANQDVEPTVEGFEDLLALRKSWLERTSAKWGGDKSRIPATLMRPYQRFLGTLLMDGPALGRNQDCIDIALESWRLGPDSGMTFLAVLTWLIAGRNLSEARDLLALLTTDDGIPSEELDLFFWWRCWLSFRAGELETATELFSQAVEAFPESDLYLFTNEESEPDLELDPDLFEENHATFGPLLEALAVDPEFIAFGRKFSLQKD
ncbi:MAG: hypothetical protein H6686_10935 [Fibrobacteria bacterium]|nr:hypothetical protein [Fibrobacteria bacterium]